jgi:outer membrane protein assembly factor BamB
MITNDPHHFTKVSTPDLPARERGDKQQRQKFRWLQSLAAVLIVGALVSGFLLVFASYHTTHTGGHVQAKPTTSTPTSANLLIASYTQNDGYTMIDALQADTGARVWTYTTRQKNASPQIILSNQVVYMATNGLVEALHAQTGKLIWQKDLHLGMVSGIAGGTSSITFDHGMLYLAFAQTSTGGDNLYAFNAQNGTLMWHHVIGVDQTFTANNGIVYLEVSSNDVYTPGSVTALRGSDGHFLWSYTTDPIAMLVANNVLYVQSAHQQTPSDQGGNKQYKLLLALNATNGHLLWSVNVDNDGPSSLVFSNNLVILYRTITQPNAAEFCAYRSSNGSRAWCTSGKEGVWDANTSSYLVASGTLYVSFNTAPNATIQSDPTTTTVEALNPQTGRAYWSKTVAAGISYATLTELRGMLYLSQNRNIVALDTNDGHTLWQIRENGFLQILVAGV